MAPKKQQTLGSVIKEYRTQNRMSARKFAVRSGISKSYIGILESGVRPDTGKEPIPSLDVIVGAAKAMEMDTMALLKKIGMDIETKEDTYEATNPASPPAKPMGKIKPFEYVPLNQSNLEAALRERRLMILPFPVPRMGDLVYLPNKSLGMAVAHTVTRVDGGVYEAYAEANGTISFSLFDIGVSVFMKRGEAQAKSHPQDY